MFSKYGLWCIFSKGYLLTKNMILHLNWNKTGWVGRFSWVTQCISRAKELSVIQRLWSSAYLGDWQPSRWCCEAFCTCKICSLFPRSTKRLRITSYIYFGFEMKEMEVALCIAIFKLYTLTGSTVTKFGYNTTLSPHLKNLIIPHILLYISPLCR